MTAASSCTSGALTPVTPAALDPCARTGAQIDGPVALLIADAQVHTETSMFYAHCLAFAQFLEASAGPGALARLTARVMSGEPADVAVGKGDGRRAGGATRAVVAAVGQATVRPSRSTPPAIVRVRLARPQRVCDLYILGTVNMNETTHGLSDKVLDRAFVIEFWEVNLDAYPKWGNTGLLASDENRVRRILAGLLAALQPARLHFGWRVVDDVFGFLRQARVGGTDSLGGALDSVLYAKIMPKLRGEDAPRFRDALEAVRKVAAEERLVRCQDKAEDLIRDLEATGSARFWR